MAELHEYIRSAVARHFTVEFFDGGQQGIGCKLSNEGAIFIGYAGSVRGAIAKAYREMQQGASR